MLIQYGIIPKKIQIVEKHKNNKPDKVKRKSLNGYDAIRRTWWNNILTAENPVVATAKPKAKISIGLN